MFNEPGLQTSILGPGVRREGMRGKTSVAYAVSSPNSTYLDCGHTPFPHDYLHEKLDFLGPPTLIAEHAAES
jgi:hypothetical protein